MLINFIFLYREIAEKLTEKIDGRVSNPPSRLFCLGFPRKAEKINESAAHSLALSLKVLP